MRSDLMFLLLDPSIEITTIEITLQQTGSTCTVPSQQEPLPKGEMPLPQFKPGQTYWLQEFLTKRSETSLRGTPYSPFLRPAPPS